MTQIVTKTPPIVKPETHIRLTDHFTLAEMLDSDKAVIKGYTEQFFPSAGVIQNLRLLCENVLEPLREQADRPVNVSSGYRCQRVNAQVGGSFTSQHMTGQAADFKVSGLTIPQTIELIRALDLPFDQLINEFGRWVHVSYSARDRRQVMIASKNRYNKTIYTHVR